jgi:ABC-2 type transport system permease protein
MSVAAQAVPGVDASTSRRSGVGVLVGKLLRDLRVPLVIVCLFLGAFQCLFVKITERIVTEITPFFGLLTSLTQKFAGLLQIAGLKDTFIEDKIFSGPGQMMQTLAGGNHMHYERAMDMLSIGYIHPLMQTIFCIWAIGRASGAIAGEIDRGTMELLLAQPIARSRVVLAHLLVDMITIPILCLSLWAGTWLGVTLVGPYKVDPDHFKDFQEFSEKANVKIEVPEKDLRIDVAAFGPGLWNIGAMIFAISGYTMWVSSAGRFRWRVMGIAVLITLLQFFINFLGQLWDVMRPLRPLSVFYYFQPQQIVLRQNWSVDFGVWNGGQPLVHVPVLLVLFGIGLAGYALATWTFHRRDLPAPL